MWPQTQQAWYVTSQIPLKKSYCQMVNLKINPFMILVCSKWAQSLRCGQGTGHNSRNPGSKLATICEMPSESSGVSGLPFPPWQGRKFGPEVSKVRLNSVVCDSLSSACFHGSLHFDTCSVALRTYICHSSKLSTKVWDDFTTKYFHPQWKIGKQTRIDGHCSSTVGSKQATR